MIADAMMANLSALETQITAQVAANALVTLDFKDISEYSDEQLGNGVVNIISTGFTRREVGIESVDAQSLAIICWVHAPDGVRVEEKEIRFLQSIERATQALGCVNIVSVTQSAKRQVPWGYLGVDITMGVE